ncbi:MAG: TRAP transporter large permease [Synergistaceae bacterium]|jgi:tripartite ATP-independent transporter DctM subunit|nr:TRAP transporter large permease [Synergistaceae bacterium]
MTIALISIGILVVMVFLGVNISFSLSLMSFCGVFFVSGNFNRALGLLATTAFDAIRSYTFCVIPLFMLMGSLMAKSGAAEDLFKFANYFVKKIPGGLAIATVLGNAVFAAVTGVSVASASVFSKIAVPEMSKFNYKKSFAVGTVAGTSVLGMLIPPSLLFIVYGMVAEVSIGKMFMAGILPGIVLSFIFIAGILVMGWIDPANIGRSRTDGGGTAAKVETPDSQNEEMLLFKTFPIIAIIIIVLGGIWGGIFTPTEASAVGALGALILALCKRSMSPKDLMHLFLEATDSCASIMFLLISAQTYSRMLAMSGVVSWVGKAILSMDVHYSVIIGVFLFLILLLGCILDSTSILLLTVPIIRPVIAGLGFDLIWFGIVLVVAVEMGMLTPPFGMVVFAIKSALGDEIALDTIFKGSVPYLVMMLVGLLILIVFPSISTFIPSLM